MQVMRSMLTMILLLIPGFIGSCSYVPIAASDPARSALDFTVALAENRKTELLRLTTDSGKVVANAWLESHPRFDCKAPFWDVDGQRAEVYPVDSSTSSESATSYNAMYICRTDEEVFVMTVQNIVLVTQDQRWLVDNWGSTCEANDYETCFDAP